jgi:hypothetical protein
MALITDTDLSTFVGEPSLVGDTRAIMMAAIASAIITDYIGLEGIESSATYTDRIFDGPARGSTVFLLPSYPVTAVTKVEIRPTWGADWEILETDTYEWNRAGFISRSGVAVASGPGYWWPRQMGSIRVAYTAGYVSVPWTVKGIALGIAARGFQSASGVLAETIGDYQVSYGAAHSSFMDLDPSEMAILGNYADWPVA